MKSSINFTRDLTIIVVAYNSNHCLPQLLGTLPEQTHIVVVDNASEQDPSNLVHSIRPDATVIRNEKNLGFGGANNIALSRVETRFTLLLNPDCLLHPSCIHTLLQSALDNPSAAVLAPHLLRGNGQLELSYRWPGIAWKSRGPKAEGPCCVGFTSGAAMLLNMDVMRRIGFFDESFFLYYEDEDLCQRIFAARKQIVIVPDAIVTHFSRGSVRGRSPLRSEFMRGYHHAQSKLLFTRKHLGIREATALRWKTLGLAILNILPRVLIPQPKYLARLAGRIFGLLTDYPRGRRPIR